MADLEIVDQLLAATSTLIVGTSIVNMWKDEAATVADSYARIQAAFPGRFVLGVGAGHPRGHGPLRQSLRHPRWLRRSAA